MKIPGGKKTIIIAVAVLAVLGGGFFTLTQLNASPIRITIGPASAAESPTQVVPPTPTPHEKPVTLMYATKERAVNLADPGGFRFIKVQVVLEFELSEKEAKSVKDLKGEAFKKKQEEFSKELADKRGPVIDDIIGTVISSKSSAEISTVEGKEKLKSELMKHLNEGAEEHAVINVYFTQFIISYQ